MKKLAAVSTALLIAGPALADGPVFVPAPLPPIAAPISDWSGPYAGLQVGYGTGTLSFPPINFGAISIDHYDLSGLLYGAHAGYNFDLGNFVLGVEVDYNLSNIEIENTSPEPSTSVVTELYHLKARAGYDLGTALVYGTAGMAWATLDSTPGLALTDTGYFVGAGADYKVSENWSVGAEYLYHQFSEFTNPNLDLELHTVHARVSYHF